MKYPLENLEINNEKFDLYAVINHFGSLNSGHYTSFVKIDNELIKVKNFKRMFSFNLKWRKC